MINGVEKVEIEVLFKILNKYGFYSLKKEPFLYAKNGSTGISFTFKDDFYGDLTRVVIPNTIEEVEDFLGKYSWHKKYGQKFHVKIKLDDYKKINPKVLFTREDQEYTLKELVELSNKGLEQEKNQKKKEVIYIKKIKRTLLLLVQVIKEKIKVQEDTYQNLLKLTQEYNQKYNQLEKVKQEYYKLKKVNFISEEKTEPLPDFSAKIEEMIKDINMVEDKELLEQQIDIYLAFIQELEKSKSLIHNKYELIKLPLELDKINQKLTLIENALSRKKGFFGKKENIDKQLEEIEEKSIVNQIVSYENYEKNELERIEEKYAMIPELDKRTIADYLIEFDNLKIPEPDLEEIPKEKEITYEEVMQSLEKDFEKRTSDEKNILTMYHSFLRKILVNEEYSFEKEIEDFINLLENPNNILFKLKYFKKIETVTPEKCLKSLRKEAQKIKSISPDVLKGNINAFFKDNKLITGSNFLAASNKRTLSPTQCKGENDINYIALLKKNALVYFIPNEITHDIENDEILIQKNNQPFFLIDLQKNNIQYSTSDIIKIVRYQNEIKTENNRTIVTNLISTKVDQYKNIVIERKD